MYRVCPASSHQSRWGVCISRPRAETQTETQRHEVTTFPGRRQGETSPSNHAGGETVLENMEAGILVIRAAGSRRLPIHNPGYGSYAQKCGV